LKINRRYFIESLAVVLIVLISSLRSFAGNSVTRVVVDINGKGDFASIQAAINSLPDSSSTPRTVYIKNGTYREKIFITKHNIIFQGEDRQKTIITQSIARDEWRCQHKDDWGVATLNIDGNDITLQNLTVSNTFGFDLKKKDTIINCKTDSGTFKKTISKDGHQMALRTMRANRLRALNCTFKAFGGDTVSPWNVDAGMFYFKNCIMEGGVDFYCPRGWAYAEDCKFIAHTGPASIWHDGSKNPDSKTVLKNCSFEGFDGFNLGRYHKDAQFYLLNCTFANNMADKDIYLVPTTTVIQWGRRVYYYNCHRKGGDYTWHKDNLNTAAGNIKPSDITVNWTFKGKWHPDEATIRIR
jgi:pectinesterase